MGFMSLIRFVCLCQNMTYTHLMSKKKKNAGGIYKIQKDQNDISSEK